MISLKSSVILDTYLSLKDLSEKPLRGTLSFAILKARRLLEPVYIDCGTVKNNIILKFYHPPSKDTPFFVKKDKSSEAEAICKKELGDLLDTVTEFDIEKIRIEDVLEDVTNENIHLKASVLYDLQWFLDESIKKDTPTKNPT